MHYKFTINSKGVFLYSQLSGYMMNHVFGTLLVLLYQWFALRIISK